tara:strand:+ start:713 stop:1414 length:702 start_codon:yes stop_codon:yes gene_type:complete
MIRSIIAIIYSMFWCGLAVVTLFIFPKSTEFVLLKYAKQFWSTPMLRWIIGAKIEVQISKKTQDLFDSKQGAILMANHSSSLDITACFVSCPTPIVFLAKASIRKIPFLGGANARAGTVFVERGNKESTLKAINQLVNTVKGGRSVVVYPEGTRSKKGELLQFKKGGFHLAVQAESPIIPVHISGTFKRLPPGSFSIKKFNDPIVVKYGDPIISNDVIELRDLTYNAVCKLRG